MILGPRRGYIPQGTSPWSLILFFTTTLAIMAGCATTSSEGGHSLDEAIERSVVDIAGKLSRGTRVAIVAFESSHENLSTYIRDKIVGSLVDGGVEVADRNAVEYASKELDFQMSGDMSNESVQSIGKFLGAHYMITGQLVDAGGRYHYWLNGINVETAIHESSTRLEVRNDWRFHKLFTTLQRSEPARSTGGGDSSTPTTAGTFLDRGIMFTSRGDYDRAIADFTEALQLDPNFAAAYYNRGFMYGNKGDYDRTIADLTEALQLDPNFARAYYNRGFMYGNKGDYDRAIADLTEALRLDPNFVAAYYNRGFAYVMTGDYTHARADLEKALQLNPNLTQVRNNLEVLRKQGY